jgi:hypothetical protein
MLLEDFLSLILPEAGVKFLVVNAQAHRAYTDISKLAQAIRAADAKGLTAYHACASYAQASYVDDEGKTRYRTAANAEAVKAFWLDIDCGPGKDYPDQAAALEALARTVEAANLPIPLTISSGNGVHVYWPLTQAITPAQWLKIAKRLRPVLEQHQLKFDHSRDQDVASILRPIETTNRKREPVPVTVLSEGAGPTAPAAFLQVLMAVPLSPTIDAIPAYLAAPESINDDLALAPREYAPVSAIELVNNCAQLRFFKDTGSDHEPHWRASIGVLKHTIEGEAVIHEWSAQYASYDKGETQAKIDNWTVPPASCEAFANHRNMCVGCALHGQGKSPISLGFVGEVTMVVVDPLSESDTPELQQVSYPPGYHPVGGGIIRRITNPKAGEEGEDPFIDLPVCDTVFYPLDRIEYVDGSMQSSWRAEYFTHGSKRYKDFVVNGRLIGERGAGLHGLLAQNEIVYPGKQKTAVEDYMVAFITKIRGAQEAVQAYRTFGWQETNDQQLGGLLLGRQLYTEDGSTSTVVLGGHNANAYLRAFNTPPGADAEEWTRLVTAAYKHPGHEQFQFVLYAAFGSALVQFGTEHTGSPISLYGGKGEGKTTAAKIGLSVWGNPDDMYWTWGTGTTTNSALKACAMFKSFPLLFDEFSNADSKTLSSVAYALGNGRDKSRMNQQGNIVMDGQYWRNVTYLTTNHSLHEALSTLKDNASAEISRILEIRWTNASAISQSQMTDLLRELKAHNGAAGKAFASYVVQNQAAVRQVIDRLKAKLDQEIGFSKEYRFWSLQIANALAAGWIATKLGLLEFDFKAVYQFAVDLGRDHLSRVTAVTRVPMESFAAMLTSFAPGIIFTKDEGDARILAEDVRIVGEPIGRVIVNKGQLYISTSAIRKWCRERSISYDDVEYACLKGGMLVDNNVRYSLGKGTKLTTGQLHCWLVNWHAATGATAEIVNYQKRIANA